MNTVGQRIRQRREELGFDHQGEFAKMIGCKQSTLSEIENGESKFPSTEVLVRMCEALSTTARWILYGENGEVNIPSKEEAELLSFYRGMPDDAKDQLRSFLKAMSVTKPPPK